MGIFPVKSLFPERQVEFGLPDAEFVNDFFQHGRQSSAYFLFQPGVQCFYGPEGGRIHYARQSTPLGPVNIIMTNPLCAQSELPGLIKAFDEAQGIPNIYAGVDGTVAEVLREMGYYTNHAGLENVVALEGFNVIGKKKKQLRHASHFGERTGCTVKELTWAQVDRGQVKALSKEWIRSKVINNREIRYCSRPATFNEEWKVRKFYCFSGDQIVGYVFFDPYYEAGELKGYCANVLRCRPGKQWNGALDFTVLEAIKVFQQEGVGELSLGLAPLHGIEAVEGEHKLVRLLCQGFYRYGNRMYAFKNLAYHKSRYRPEEIPWFLCMKDVSLFRLYWGLLFGLNAIGKKEL